MAVFIMLPDLEAMLQKKCTLGAEFFIKRKQLKKTEETTKQDEERAKLCQDSKDTMAKYKSAPFLYRYDDERKQKVRLTEKESKETFLQAEKDVSYWCNPPQKSAEAE